MNDLLKGLPQDKADMARAYVTIQMTNEDIMLLSTQYAVASVHQNAEKKKECAKLMVERAKVLLENAEKLALLG